MAAKYGNLSVLRTLLVAESNPFIRNKDGWLAYETAERFGQTEAKVLLECLMQVRTYINVVYMYKYTNCINILRNW